MAKRQKAAVPSDDVDAVLTIPTTARDALEAAGGCVVNATGIMLARCWGA